jgi:hypothetical protein
MFVTNTCMVECLKAQIYPAALQQHCYFMVCVDAGDTKQQLHIIKQSLQLTPGMLCIASNVKTAFAIVAATLGNNFFY